MIIEQLAAEVIPFFLPEFVLSEDILRCLIIWALWQHDNTLSTASFDKRVTQTVKYLTDHSLIKKKLLLEVKGNTALCKAIPYEKASAHQKDIGYPVFVLTRDGFRFAFDKGQSRLLTEIRESATEQIYEFRPEIRSDEMNRAKKASDAEVLLALGRCLTPRCPRGQIPSLKDTYDTLESNSTPSIIDTAIKQLTLYPTENEVNILEEGVYLPKKELLGRMGKNSDRENVIGALFLSAKCFLVFHTSWKTGTSWTSGKKKQLVEQVKKIGKEQMGVATDRFSNAIMIVSSPTEFRNLVLSAHAAGPQYLKRQFRLKKDSCTNKKIMFPFDNAFVMPATADGLDVLYCLKLKPEDCAMRYFQAFSEAFAAVAADVSAALFGQVLPYKVVKSENMEKYRNNFQNFSWLDDTIEKKAITYLIPDFVVWQNGFVIPVFFGFDLSLNHASLLYYYMYESPKRTIIQEHIFLACPSNFLKYYKKLFPNAWCLPTGPV